MLPLPGCERRCGCVQQDSRRCFAAGGLCCRLQGVAVERVRAVQTVPAGQAAGKALLARAALSVRLLGEDAYFFYIAVPEFERKGTMAVALGERQAVC